MAETERLCEIGEVRTLEIPCSIRLIIVDECETLISALYDDSTSIISEGDVAIWTDEKNISRFMNYFFYHLWNEAKPVVTKLPT